MLEMHFQSISGHQFSKFTGRACPQTPLQGVKKFFLAPALLEKFLDHNLQVLDSTKLAGLNIKDFSSSD